MKTFVIGLVVGLVLGLGLYGSVYSVTSAWALLDWKTQSEVDALPPGAQKDRLQENLERYEMEKRIYRKDEKPC